MAAGGEGVVFEEGKETRKQGEEGKGKKGGRKGK